MFWRQTINASWAPKPEITRHEGFDGDELGKRHIQESIAKYGHMVGI